MFNWNDVRVLLEVVRAGSVAGASATLRLDPSTVTRRIQALERDLGTRCFDRRSGRLVLTPEAAPILEQAQRIEEAAAAIERAVHPDSAPVAGRVRVATTRTMASTVVLPAIEALTQRHPQVMVEVDSQAQRIVVMRGEADLALTCYQVHHPRLIQRSVFSAMFAMYGSRDYLKGRTMPRVGDFEGHDILGMAEMNGTTDAGPWWSENVKGGRVILRSSSVEELTRLCVDGRGLALLFCFRAEQHPELVRLPDLPTSSLPHWLVVHPDMQHLPRVRVVIEALDARIHELRGSLEDAPAKRGLQVVQEGA